MPNIKGSARPSAAKALAYAPQDTPFLSQRDAPFPSPRLGQGENQERMYPSFTDAVERLADIHGRISDQVMSLGALGNLYLGACPADDPDKIRKSPPDGAGTVNVIAAQLDDIDSLVSLLEGKINRFRGRH